MGWSASHCGGRGGGHRTVGGHEFTGASCIADRRPQQRYCHYYSASLTPIEALLGRTKACRRRLTAYAPASLWLSAAPDARRSAACSRYCVFVRIIGKESLWRPPRG